MATSVISTRIQKFDSALYTSIYDKEQYCYTQTSQGTSAYEPFFQSLNDAIIAWMQEDRTAEIKDFFNNLYAYIIFNNNYGTPSSYLSQAHMTNLFDMDGYVERIKTDSNSYYADYIAPTTTTVQGTTVNVAAKCPNLQADTTLIQNSFAVEQKNVKQMGDRMQVVIATKHFDLLFDDYPPVASMTKQDVGNYIFNTLGYLTAFQNLNIKLNLPSYI